MLPHLSFIETLCYVINEQTLFTTFLIIRGIVLNKTEELVILCNDKSTASYYYYYTTKNQSIMILYDSPGNMRMEHEQNV